MVRRRLRFIRRQMHVQLRMRVLSGYTLFVLLVQPVVFSGVGFALAHMAGRETPDLIYTIVGGGFMGLWGGMLFTSFFDVTLDRVEGTLELIIGSPMSFNTVLAVRVLTNVLVGMVSLLGSFFIALLAFGYSLALESVVALIISFIVVIFTFWSLGVFLANFHAWSRMSAFLINYLEMPVAMLGGFMYPVSILPVWMLPISAILPLRWSIAALNKSLAPALDHAALWSDWLFAVGLSLLYLLLARWLAGQVHDKIRISGNMSSQ